MSSLPEGWNLPSYLAVVIQIANVGPLVYTVLHHMSPRRIHDWHVVYLIMVIGATSCILLAFFWNITVFVAGSEHSGALFILVTLLALVDCTSSVVFLPYIAGFKPYYLTALFIGEGFSGLVPGIAGLIQGVGGETQCINQTTINITDNSTMYTLTPAIPKPLFSVEAFFFMLFGIMCVSCMAFTLLHFLPFCAKEKIQPTLFSNDHREQTSSRDKQLCEDTSRTENSSPHIRDRLISETFDDDNVPATDKDAPLIVVTSDSTSSCKFAYLLCLTCVITAFTNGVLPSVQSYSALPYGNTAYTLVVRLSTVANPLACFMVSFYRSSSLAAITGLTVVGLTLSGYHVFLAIMSPFPPFLHEDTGGILVVCKPTLSRKHATLNQSCSNVGPSSPTLVQH